MRERAKRGLRSRNSVASFGDGVLGFRDLSENDGRHTVRATPGEE